MSKKLFVGCRVRILYSRAWPELAGHEGRIIDAVTSRDFCAPGEFCEWKVAPDCWGSDYAPDGSGFFGPAGYQLEPILPSGHRSGDYSYTELMDRLKAGEVECV